MGACFLAGAAFFPRLTLLLFWVASAIPANQTPFLVDVLCAFFCPRLLVAWWLYEAGQHPLLVAVFVILELAEKFSSRVTVRRSGD